MHVKGPEILNMWVGESERMVREMFATAREKRREGFMPFLFIDEAESILGTRRASRYSNIFRRWCRCSARKWTASSRCNDVVIILASNRADLIDPAILRPGRIDRKIKVNRPNQEGRARDLPNLSDDRSAVRSPRWSKEAAAIRRGHRSLVETVRRPAVCASRRESIPRSHVAQWHAKKRFIAAISISGAIIASIVERAKEMAIKRVIASAAGRRHQRDRSASSLDAEYAENDIFPPTDITEDWLKLIDYDPENVVKVSPVRPRGEARTHFSGVI